MHPRATLRLPFLYWKAARLRAYLRAARRARSIQAEVLREKLARHRDTTFGREHRFSELHRVADYRQRMPITDYEYHRPYIQQVMQGNLAAMFPASTRLLMFAMTSGTTNEPKYLPVTEDFYRQYKASWQYWGTGVYRDYPRLLGLQTLQFSSHWQVTQSPSGVPCGNISGLAAETRPIYMRPLFVLPPAVIRILDHASKHYTALRLSLASSRVGKVITANPSTLIEVAKRADREKETLIRDIHDGTLRGDAEVPAAIRDELRPWLRPQPQRARQLQRVVETTGHLYPKDAWPDLTLLAVWTGGAVGIYLPQLQPFYGDVAIRDHGLSASEGRMTIPLSDRTSAGLLDFSSHYYEFIPEEEHGRPQPTVLGAHELSPGKHYFILLTTSAGLYRYDIQDVVRCEGYEGEAPLLSFMNKGKHFSSMTGEKLSEYQVIQAMRETCEALGVESSTFTLAPTMGVKPRYQLWLDTPSLLGRRQQLATELQRRLEVINVEYGDKCQSGRIEPLEVCEVPAGAWAALRAAKSRERGNFEEYKHPCLTSDLHFMEKLQALTAASSP